jgi:adenine-specific DNA-methyltransferase
MDGRSGAGAEAAKAEKRAERAQLSARRYDKLLRAPEDARSASARERVNNERPLMPEFFFKGKEFVYNHHLSVPFRPLVPHGKKSIGKPNLGGNLVIHGDNLHALKALLPLYAGKVDCVFIDPPYNTGNEGWSYNDNVNSPMMREWLKSNPVGIEDGLRHDKWLCMMYPRLKLLHELMSDAGSFWMTLDDNEFHHARDILDDIFGEQNFVTTCIWHKMDSPKNTAEFFSVDHDYVLVYAKNKALWNLNLLPRTAEMRARYRNPDDDPRGDWMLSDLDARNYYSKGVYPITTPSGRVIKGPPQGRYWSVSKEKFQELDADNRIWWGEDKNSEPNIKRFITEVRDGVVPQTLWRWADVGSTRNAKTELLNIMGKEAEHEVFITPKPTRLLDRVLAIATRPDSIVLDSFAGSGTTAHAVLSANKKDGGNRRFILVESEDYADTLTAERMRRVMSGYKFKGKQREELYRESLTMTSLKKADTLLAHIESIENLRQGEFDVFSKTVKGGELLVFGERTIEEKVNGLGSAFTYCTLGDALEMDKLLTGENLPSFEALGAVLFHTATSESFDGTKAYVREGQGYLGESSGFHVWLIYKPDLDFLKSREAALTLSLAEKLVEEKPGKRHLVFAPAKFVSKKLLDERGLPVEHAPLPFALYRIDRT